MDNEEAEDILGLIDECIATIRVARNQYRTLSETFYKENPYLKPEYFATQDHNFIAIPEAEETTISTAVQYLKRFSVTLDHMAQQSPDGDLKEKLIEGRQQVEQVLGYFRILQESIEDGDAVDDTLPKLPEELKAESSRSARQRRDVIVIRNYERLLDLLETVISRVGA